MLKRFRTAEGGAVAIMFGLTFVAIIGIVALTIDYSRATTRREMLQAAVDAAVQSAAVANANPGQKRQMFDAALAANLAGASELSNIIPTVAIDSATNKVTATVSADLKTSFGAAIGFGKLKIAVRSEMQGGKVDVEFALVLDVSGSMRATMGAGTRMDALKSAATS